MADTYYAWSPIQYDVTRDSNNYVTGRKEIALGAKVTKADIGADDREWASLIESGVIRTTPFPDDLQADETPRTRNIRVAKAMLDEASGGQTKKTGKSSKELSPSDLA